MCAWVGVPRWPRWSLALPRNLPQACSIHRDVSRGMSLSLPCGGDSREVQHHCAASRTARLGRTRSFEYGTCTRDFLSRWCMAVGLRTLPLSGMAVFITLVCPFVGLLAASGSYCWFPGASSSFETLRTLTKPLKAVRRLQYTNCFCIVQGAATKH